MKSKISFLLILLSLNISGFSQWTVLNSGTNEFLYNLSFPSPTTGYVVDELGDLHKTVNGGDNWSIVSSGIGKICFTDVQTGHTCYGNEILKTTDGGSNWSVKLTIESSRNITGIDFIDANTGYAATGNYIDSLLIYKTIDGGETWNLQGFDLINNQDVHMIDFIDANVGYLSNWDGQLLKTVNGGLNWNIVYTSSGEMINDVRLATSSIGYGVTDMAFLKTTDGGNSWAESTPPFSPLFAALDITPDGTIHVTGGNGINTGTLIKSINSGTSWTQTGTSVQAFYDVVFLNDSLGFACGTNGTILRFGSVPVEVTENAAPQISIFPNPAFDNVFIQIENDEHIQNIFISDQSGRIVFSSNKKEDVVSLQKFSNGIYFMQIETENGIFRNKIIKQ